MINRGNWKLYKDFMQYRLAIGRLSSGSMTLERTCMTILLEWLDDKAFWQAPKVNPDLNDYLLFRKNDGYSKSYSRKVIGTAYRFFQWLIKYHPQYQKYIHLGWLDTLKPLRTIRDDNEHEFVTLDEIRAISQAPFKTIRDRRIQAAVVFLFLSGMRGGAFVTLPIKAVDIKKRLVYQWPNLGVHTKFGKKATTHILDIPDLIKVIEDWDNDVRKYLPDTSYWFAPLSPETGFFDPSIIEVGNCRISRLNKDIRNWLSEIGLPYHSSHKFRHGHAVYGLQNSNDIADFKAISQNLMHSNLSITDGVYGMFSVDDVGKRITNLGKKVQNHETSMEEVMVEIQELREIISKNFQKPGTSLM